MTKPPRISVIIPTLDRATVVERLVRQVLNQTHPDFEVVVVDQSAVVNQALLDLANNDQRLKYLRLDSPGTCRARNRGLNEATGDIVLFFDDDVEIGQTDLLSIHASNYADPTIGGVGGRVEDKNQVLNRETTGRVCWATPDGRVFPNATGRQRVDINAPRGGHMSFRASVARAVGGFDEQFVGNAMREETDFSLRVAQAGHRLVFEPRATVVHLGLATGGSRTGDRRRWYEDFFANELYFFLKHSPRRFLPWFYWRKLRAVLACMFYYGRGRWSWLTTPGQGFAAGRQRFAKQGGVNQGRSARMSTRNIIIALGLTVIGGWLVGKFGLTGVILTALICAAAGLAAAVIRDPRLGLLALVFLLPFERIGSVEVAGFTLRASQVIGGLTLVVWLVNLIAGRGRRRIWPNPTWPLAVLFLVTAAASIVGAANQFRAVTIFCFVAFTIAISWVIPQLLKEAGQLRRLVMVLLLTTALVSSFGLFQFAGDLVGLPAALTGLREQYTSEVFGFPRIQSTFIEPLYYANFLLIPLCLAASFILSGVKLVKPIFLFGLILLAGLNFVLTLSRGGYIAWLVALIPLGLVYWRKVLVPHRLVLGLVVVLIIGLGAVQFLGLTGDKEENLTAFTRQATGLFTGASYADRASTFTDAWAMFKAHPWLGVGIGNFGPNVALTPLVEPEHGWLIVNNEFLELLAETGFLGCAFICLIMLVLLIRTISAIRRARDPFVRAVLVGLLAAFVGVIAQYQTFSILYIMHIWFLFGLMVAVQNMALSSRDSHAELVEAPHRA